MNTERQNIVIATICGWYQCPVEENPDFRWRHPDYISPHDPRPEMKGRYGLVEPPNYHNNLNAMHDAEGILTHEQYTQFHKELAWVVSKDEVYSGPRYFLIHATAAQRAEAFLRTLNLWTDE